MGIFGGFFARSTDGLYPVPSTGLIYSTLSADVGDITPETAMRHSAVWSCNQAIADAMSSVSLKLYRRTQKGKEEITDSSLSRILRLSPNPYMTSFEWRQMIITDLNLRGRHYSQIVRNGRGEVLGLYPLIADNMQVMLDEAKNVVYVYTVDGDQVAIPSEDVLHIKGLPDRTGLDGLSPIAYNADTIKLAKTAETYGVKYFENGANAGGILSHPGQLSIEAADKLRKQFKDRYQGLANTGKPILLEEGMKFEKLTISNEDSQFLETRKFQKAEIAGIFKVPLYMLGEMDKSTFNNMEQMSTNFVVNTLRPIAVKIEQAIEAQILASDPSLFVRFNLNSLMRGDYKSRTDGYRTLIDIGVMTPNEVRQLEGLDAMGDAGDAHLIQLNMTTLERAVKGETK